MISLNKGDKQILNQIVDNLQKVLRCAKLDDYNTFHKDMVRDFRDAMKLHKAVQLSVKKGLGIDLLRKDINNYYVKASNSIEHWCKKYGAEFTNIVVVREYTQIVLRSLGTNEGFTFTIIAR